jgi:hypothetical protein
MALTIYKQPQELTPAYNKQIITALSDEITEPDFKYIVEVLVNGDTVNTYREEILQNPDGWLVFDAQNWVKNYIKHYFNPSDTGVVIATDKVAEVSIDIIEYYLGVEHPADSENVGYIAFDACLNDDEFRNYDFEDYLFGEDANKYLLGKEGINEVDSVVTLTQDVWLHFFNGDTDPVTGVVVELRRGGSTVGGFSSSIPTPLAVREMYALNVGGISGAQVGDTVRVNFNGASGLIKRFTLTLSDVCTKFTDYSLYYLDRYGAIQYKHFEMLSTKNYTKKVNKVKLDKDVLNTTTGAYGSNTYDRENHIVSTAIESNLVLNTNWITKEQSTLLLDLWASPIKYLWDGTTLKSCDDIVLNYEEKTESLDPLFNYTITVDLGITETRQRGL